MCGRCKHGRVTKTACDAIARAPTAPNPPVRCSIEIYYCNSYCTRVSVIGRQSCGASPWEAALGTGCFTSDRIGKAGGSCPGLHGRLLMEALSMMMIWPARRMSRTRFSCYCTRGRPLNKTRPTFRLAISLLAFLLAMGSFILLTVSWVLSYQYPHVVAYEKNTWGVDLWFIRGHLLLGWDNWVSGDPSPSHPFAHGFEMYWRDVRKFIWEAYEPPRGWGFKFIQPKPGINVLWMPQWVVVVPLFFLATWRGLRLKRRYFQTLFDQRTKTGRCTRCGYDLRASPDKCPECGSTAHASQSHTKASPGEGHE